MYQEPPGSRGAENSGHAFSTWGKENVELSVSLLKLFHIFICRLYTLLAGGPSGNQLCHSAALSDLFTD